MFLLPENFSQHFLSISSDSEDRQQISKKDTQNNPANLYGNFPCLTSELFVTIATTIFSSG